MSSDIAAHYSKYLDTSIPGFEVIKHFSFLTHFLMLINLNLLTTANSFLLNIAEHENFSADKYENANYCFLTKHGHPRITHHNSG